MLGITHLTIGLLLLFILAEHTTLIRGNEILASILILLGSILPDIDHSKSLIGRKFKFLKWFVKHRGFFHSILAALLFTLVVRIFLGEILAIVFLIGYGSHLFADSLTKEGVVLFYPLKKKFKGNLKVGSFAETLVFLLLVIVTVHLLF